MQSFPVRSSQLGDIPPSGDGGGGGGGGGDGSKVQNSSGRLGVEM